jgi:hypothetical protein
MNSLSIKSLSLALGVSFALGVLFLGLVAISGLGQDTVDVLGSFYIGYDATFIGAIIGAIWGFVHGAISGLLIGFFYNTFVKVFAHKKKIIKVQPHKKRKAA